MRLAVTTLLAAALLTVAPRPAFAQAAGFTLVNNTDIDFREMMVRRFGSAEWVPLVVVPLPLAKGARGAADFSNPECAFDLRATLPDGQTVLWSGVNLCEAKVVTLNRNARGVLWVDYR